MENNLFDNEIKKLLADIEVPFEGTHWSEMAQRLKETTVANHSDELSSFDQTIAQKASSFEAPFNEQNWLALRQRLITNAYLHKWIFHTKVLEGFTMALLAFLFVSTVDLTPKQIPNVKYQGPIASTARPSVKMNRTIAQETVALISKDSRQLETAGLDFIPLYSIQRGQHPLNLIQHLTGDLDYPTQNIPLAVIEVPRDIVLRSPTTVLNILLNNNNLDLPRVAFPKKTKSNLGIAVYGVINADYIQTGRDEKHNIDLPNIWSSGYGVGVALSKQVGRQIYNIGIEYQTTQYDPKPIVLISEGNATDGYAGSGTSTVALSMVKLPITVGHALFENNRHQVSLNLGLTAGLATETFNQSTYVLGSHNDKSQKELAEKVTGSNQASVYTQPSTNTGELTNQLQKTKAKLFAFATASIGYEYKLSQDHSLFTKASYQHQVSTKGIGLPNDKLNSVGFQFGLRAYL